MLKKEKYFCCYADNVNLSLLHDTVKKVCKNSYHGYGSTANTLTIMDQQLQAIRNIKTVVKLE